MELSWTQRGQALLCPFWSWHIRGHDGQGQNGQNRKRTVKIRHYNINILFIYSEQWSRSRNRKWPKWPWPNDQDGVLVTYCSRLATGWWDITSWSLNSMMKTVLSIETSWLTAWLKRLIGKALRPVVCIYIVARKIVDTNRICVRYAGQSGGVQVLRRWYGCGHPSFLYPRVSGADFSGNLSNWTRKNA